MSTRWVMAIALALALPSGTPGQEPLRFVVATPPLGLPTEMPEPADNAGTPERVALGQRLFFERALSADGKISCASCHDPEHGWASPEPLSIGVHGQRTVRHAPTLLNRAFGRAFMWDARFTTLEEQVLQPIVNPLEMGLTLKEALAKLGADPEYPPLFAAAFADGLTQDNLARALAAFVRRIQIGRSPVDLFRDAQVADLDDDEKTGLWVYESKGRCWRCHSGPNFSDEEVHNTGVGAKDSVPERGRHEVTGQDADRGRFKTPTLRGLAFTAPYMHDGSLATLEEVVAFYRRGGEPNSHLDPKIEPLDLTDREARALVAFLKALSREVEAR